MSPGYRTWTREKMKSCSISWSLSGLLEVKYDLDRTGIKKLIKTAENCMHWNVALPGSATTAGYEKRDHFAKNMIFGIFKTNTISRLVQPQAFDLVSELFGPSTSQIRH